MSEQISNMKISFGNERLLDQRIKREKKTRPSSDVYDYLTTFDETFLNNLIYR